MDPLFFFFFFLVLSRRHRLADRMRKPGHPDETRRTLRRSHGRAPARVSHAKEETWGSNGIDFARGPMRRGCRGCVRILPWRIEPGLTGVRLQQQRRRRLTLGAKRQRHRAQDGRNG